MLTTAMLLLKSSLFLSLHLAGNISSFPKPLSPEEERSCLERCAQGDLEARNTLIEHNMRLVAHIIKKYYTQSVDQDDLISIGTIGLIKGISSYKPEKNVRLATYAARCIENEILMFFRSQKKLQGEVSLSDTLETDKDGNNLFLMDVMGVEDTMLEDLDTRESQGKPHSGPPAGGGVPDGAGGGYHPPALRPGRADAQDPAGASCSLWYFKVLCIPPPLM